MEDGKPGQDGQNRGGLTTFTSSTLIIRRLAQQQVGHPGICHNLVERKEKAKNARVRQDVCWLEGWLRTSHKSSLGVLTWCTMYTHSSSSCRRSRLEGGYCGHSTSAKGLGAAAESTYNI